MRSILKMIKIALPIPDYTTISRRIRDVAVNFITNLPQGKINLILDSTGIKVVGEKEWACYKYNQLKQRRIWRKLHIGVTDDGSIVAGEVTTLRDSDIATVPILLSQTKNKIMNLVGDGAYYKKRMTEYIAGNDNTLEAKFIGLPGKVGTNYGNRLKVEETFSRYKRIIGEPLAKLS